ncbi:MAG: DUF6763 family protein [Methylococcaceae bacterium]
MSTIADPILGSWYRDLENDLRFKVIAIEDGGDSIEVQYFDGTIGEYDKESWYASTFDYIEEHGDWSAPFDDVELDDLGYSDNDRHSRLNSDEVDIETYFE